MRFLSDSYDMSFMRTNESEGLVGEKTSAAEAPSNPGVRTAWGLGAVEVKFERGMYQTSDFV